MLLFGWRLQNLHDAAELWRSRSFNSPYPIIDQSMDPDLRLRLRRQWAGALAITGVCASYATLLMATQPQKTEKAQWNDAEVKALLDYLLEHWAEGEGGGFKQKTHNGVAAHIASYLTQGPVKTGKMCKTKWTSVCYYTIHHTAY